MLLQLKDYDRLKEESDFLVKDHIQQQEDVTRVSHNWSKNTSTCEILHEPKFIGTHNDTELYNVL